MELNDAATAMDALGTPVRLEVYRALVRAGRPGLSIGEVQARLGGVPRSTLAHHLSKLVAAGLITQQKEGASVISQANYAVMEGLVAFLTEQCCTEEAGTYGSCESVA
jgi:ArsR family transcriptional regulator